MAFIQRYTSHLNLSLVTLYLLICVDARGSISFQDIERFSIERRGKVIPMRWEAVYDFSENLSEAK
jgi:hypothetical protein